VTTSLVLGPDQLPQLPSKLASGHLCCQGPTLTDVNKLPSEFQQKWKSPLEAVTSEQMNPQRGYSKHTHSASTSHLSDSDEANL